MRASLPRPSFSFSLSLFCPPFPRPLLFTVVLAGTLSSWNPASLLLCSLSEYTKESERKRTEARFHLFSYVVSQALALSGRSSRSRSSFGKNTHSHIHTLSLTLCYAHTHTLSLLWHWLFFVRPLWEVEQKRRHTQILTYTLSLSHTHTITRTHTHTFTVSSLALALFRPSWEVGQKQLRPKLCLLLSPFLC